VVRLAAAGASFARIPRYLGAFRIHELAKTATIPEVCARELEQLLAAAARTLGPAPRSRAVALLERRWRFCRRGEWGYALLGGTRWLPREALAANEAAARWAEEPHRA
jgi:hypothetical protein